MAEGIARGAHRRSAAVRRYDEVVDAVSAMVGGLKHYVEMKTIISPVGVSAQLHNRQSTQCPVIVGRFV
jgi:hypothetical protein